MSNHIISAGAGGLVGWTIATELANSSFFNTLDSFLSKKPEFEIKHGSFGEHHNMLSTKLTVFLKDSLDIRLSKIDANSLMVIDKNSDELTLYLNSVFIPELLKKYKRIMILGCSSPEMSKYVEDYNMIKNKIMDSQCSKIVAQDNDKYLKLLADKDRQIKTLDQESKLTIDRTSEELKQLQSTILNLQNTNNAMLVREKTMSDSLEDFTAQLGFAKKTLEEKNDEILKLNHRADELNLAIINLTNTNNHLNNQVKTLQSELAAAQESCRLDMAAQLSSNILSVLGKIAQFASHNNIESLRGINASNYRGYVDTAEKRKIILESLFSLYLPIGEKIVISKKFKIDGYISPDSYNTEAFMKLVAAHIHMLQMRTFR